jgi:P2-related tail formation protein
MADQMLIPSGIRDENSIAMNEIIDRMGSVDLTPLLVYIIDNVTETALPHLIEQFHVAGNEGGILAENDTNKRTLLKRAIALHRLKGTPAGVKQAIAAIGFGDATIIERSADWRLDGAVSLDGTHHLSSAEGWAEYIMTIARPVTNDQAQMIRNLCAEFAPARCVLTAINFTRASFRLNGKVSLNGTYNLGIA